MDEEIQDAEVLEGEVTASLSSKIQALFKFPWPAQSKGLIEALHFRDPDMTDEELYSILVKQARKWGVVSADEYEDIPSKEIIPRQQFDLIPYERTPVKAYNFMELIETEDLEAEWEMDGFLVEQSLFAFGGDSGIGKSQAMIRLGIALATSGEFLGYKTNKAPRRLVFFSLEMHAKNIKKMLRDMSGDLSAREKKLIRENFIFLPYGERLALNQKESQLEYWRAMQEFKPDGIFIDSWSQAVSGDLNNNEINRDAMAFVMLLRKQFNCFIGIIHHAKKKQNDTVFTDQDALYGSIYFTTPLDLGVVMYKNKKDPKKIEFNIVKNRFEELPSRPLLIRRTGHLNFMLESSSVDAMAILSDTPKKLTPTQKRKEANNKKMEQSLGEMLGLGGEFKFEPYDETADLPAGYDPKLLDGKGGDDVAGFEF